MNNKITFPRLATLLADRSGRSKRFSEDFLREFFSLISETLESRENVKIKGFGTFRLSRVEPRRSVDVTTGEPMEISGHMKVSFIPSKELAEAVNAPFEAFTAIEISDDTDIEQLFSNEDLEILQKDEMLDDEKLEEERFEDKKYEVSAENEVLETVIVPEPNTEETLPPIEDIVSPILEDTEDNIPVDVEQMDVNVDDNISMESETNLETESSDDFEEYTEENTRKKNWIKGIMITLGAAVIALFATFAVWYVFATNDFNKILKKADTTASIEPASGFVVGKSISEGNATTPESIVSVDSAEDSAPDEESEIEVPTSPSDALVYDTISTTRYLTTMAKAHYGNYNLWPYIYQENQSFLGHPDRIRPGTPVVIPKLSKYGVDPTKKEDIEKAKKLGIEIYARYGKQI